MEMLMLRRTEEQTCHYLFCTSIAPCFIVLRKLRHADLSTILKTWEQRHLCLTTFIFGPQWCRNWEVALCLFQHVYNVTRWSSTISVDTNCWIQSLDSVTRWSNTISVDTNWWVQSLDSVTRWSSTTSVDTNCWIQSLDSQCHKME